MQKVRAPPGRFDEYDELLEFGDHAFTLIVAVRAPVEKILVQKGIEEDLRIVRTARVLHPDLADFAPPLAAADAGQRGCVLHQKLPAQGGVFGRDGLEKTVVQADKFDGRQQIVVERQEQDLGAEFHVGTLEGVAHRGANVFKFGAHRIVGFAVCHRLVGDVRAEDQFVVVREVAFEETAFLAGLGQPLERICPRRFQQPVAC